MLESGRAPLQTQASLAPRVLLLLSLDSALSSLFPVWQDAFEKVGKTNISEPEKCAIYYLALYDNYTLRENDFTAAF